MQPGQKEAAYTILFRRAFGGGREKQTRSLRETIDKEPRILKNTREEREEAPRRYEPLQGRQP